jgi:hypothetical protein
MKRIVSVVFSLAIAMGALLSAHGGEPHIRGVVVSATDTVLVVKPTSGSNQTLAIDATTKVLRGRSKGSLQDVKVGDRVVVHVMKHADHLMAEEIDLPGMAPKKAK